MSLFHFHKYRFSKQTTSQVDRAMTIAAVVHPMMSIPQIVKIYANHSATDVSLLTWAMFLMIGIVFLAYGIVHKIKPLIITQLLWFVADVIIIVGILLYS